MNSELPTALGAVASLLFGVLWVPVTVFSLQVFAARPHQSNQGGPAANGGGLDDSESEPRPRLAVLVPAHNEAVGIAATLIDVLSQLNAGDRLLVVADNCSDATADVARHCGAEVIERQHDTLRGKGYALDFGLQHLATVPPEVLIVVDADCSLDACALQRLAVACARTQRPVQGLYLMHAPVNAPLGRRVAAFAWRVKNWLRPLGASRLGMPCPLMGTGMAFPWMLIGGMSLATAHLVEDMKLGIELARAGSPPLFVPEAKVNSMFPLAREAVQAQRARWEHGHLSMLLTEGPSLLGRALVAWDLRLAAMALDLMVPPLTLLLGSVLLAVATGVVMLLVASALPAWVACGCLTLMLVAIARAWWLVGRDLLSWGDLLRAPAHAVLKIPLYLKFITNRQKEWVRTERHDDNS